MGRLLQSLCLLDVCHIPLGVICCEIDQRPQLSRNAGVRGIAADVCFSIIAFSTFPGGLYTLIERGILRRNTPVVGARSVFRLLQAGNLANVDLQCLGIFAPSIRIHKNVSVKPLLRVSSTVLLST